MFEAKIGTIRCGGAGSVTVRLKASRIVTGPLPDRRGRGRRMPANGRRSEHQNFTWTPTMNSRPGIELPRAVLGQRIGAAGFWFRAMKMGCWLTSKMLFKAAMNFTPLWGFDLAPQVSRSKRLPSRRR